MAFVAIHYNCIKDIAWQNSKVMFKTKEGHLDLWMSPIYTRPDLLSSLSSVLNQEEIDYSKKYRFKKNEESYIFSKAITKILLAKYLSIPPKEIVFKFNSSTKPYLKNSCSNSLYFNISHSANTILIAISSTEIGVDIEFYDNNFSFTSILEECFSEKERLFIKESKTPLPNFYKLWTRKEALLKATGIGLLDDISQIPSLSGSHKIDEHIINSDIPWQISSFEVEKQLVASICYNTTIKKINFLRIPINCFF